MEKANITSILASFATMKNLFDARSYQNPYQLLSEFISYIISSNNLHSFTAVEMKNRLQDSFGFEIPEAVVKTSIKSLDFIKSENKQFVVGFKNSVLTTIPTVLILMITTSMASYVLARYQSRFYKFMYSLFLMGILIPFQCLMLPLFVNLHSLNLTSTPTGFIIARTGIQVSISVLVVTGFIKTVPRELEESAYIDGCNRFQIFWRIVFPLLKPVNVTQMVLNSLFVWNDYNVAIVILRERESQTLPLAQIIYFNENTAYLNLAFAFFTMTMLPILILYFSMQKFIVSGIMAGAVKG